VFEIAPARDAVMAALSERIRTHGGTAWSLSTTAIWQPAWRHAAGGADDHQFDPPLAHPGEADITSHVDFEQLARRAVAEGLQINGLTYQGDFLIALGLAERAAALGRDKGAETQENIRADAERLAGAGEGKMGELFKVLVVSSPNVSRTLPEIAAAKPAATPAVGSMD
jgi:SAM-dependent MidA family methyltransferase